MTALGRYWTRISELVGSECVAYSTEEYAAFVEGRLRPGDARAIAAHLETCEECRWLVEQLRAEMVEAAGTAPVVRLRPSRPVAMRWAWASAAAVAVVALALGLHFVRSGLGPAGTTEPSPAIIAEATGPAATETPGKAPGPADTQAPAGTGAPLSPGQAMQTTAGEGSPAAQAGTPAGASKPQAPSASPSRRGMTEAARPRTPASTRPSDRTPRTRQAPVSQPREMLASRPPRRPAAQPPVPHDEPIEEGPADVYNTVPRPMSIPGLDPGQLALTQDDPAATYAPPRGVPLDEVVNPLDPESAQLDVYGPDTTRSLYAPLEKRAPVGDASDTMP